jgi:flagella basal body P-ring formation protein FlgA
MAQGHEPVERTERARLAQVCGAVFGALLLVAGAQTATAREAALPVPRMTVYPGTAITQDMLAVRTFRGKDFDAAGYAAAPEDVIGKVARKTLLPNVPISTAGVRDPFTVVQGQPAVVVFRSGALMISSVAVPLQNGSSGEVISLRNTDSGTTIRGIVQADGTVRVGQP